MEGQIIEVHAIIYIGLYSIIQIYSNILALTVVAVTEMRSEFARASGSVRTACLQLFSDSCIANKRLTHKLNQTCVRTDDAMQQPLL